MKEMLFFGFGFTAEALSPRLAAMGWTITGTTTTLAGADRLRALGHEALIYDGTAPSRDVVEALQRATHVVVSAPPGDSGDPVLVHHRSEISAAPSVQWIGYLSTIGVYGNHDGAWVDETTPATPGSQRSKRRVRAEREWLSMAEPGARRVQVFRLAGIYGPGRSAIEQVLSGRARRVVKPGQVFNRIHVADIAATLEAAIVKGGRHDIYNVTDDEPAPPQDVIALAAVLLGQPPPPEIPFNDAEMSPMGRSFYSELKRVRNDRIKQDLGVELTYPTYREGLAAIAAARG